MNIWRNCPSGRLLSADLLMKQNGGMSQSIAFGFFEYVETGGEVGTSVPIIMATMDQFGGGVL